MPKLNIVEKRIFEVEGFQVEFVDANGKNMRGDKQIPKQYEAERATRNSFSVSDYKEKLKFQYPGYDFKILNSDGSVARGQTKLATVRDTYLED